MKKIIEVINRKKLIQENQALRTENLLTKDLRRTIDRLESENALLLKDLEKYINCMEICGELSGKAEELGQWDANGFPIVGGKK